MEADAIEIRLRATRRMDQMRVAQKETIGLNKGGQPKNRVDDRPSTLAEAGITKNLAHEGRQLGALREPEFERAVETARDPGPHPNPSQREPTIAKRRQS